MSNSRPTTRQIHVFLLEFLLLWVGAWLLHVVVTGRVRDVMVAGSLTADTIYWAAMKLLIWVAFPIRYFRDKVGEAPAFLGTSRQHIGKGIRHGLVAATIWVVGSYVVARLSHQTMVFAVRSWPVLVYAAGFTPAVEELVFRGYVLSGLLANDLGFGKANLLTSLAFLLPHLVGWSFQGVVFRQILSAGAVSVVAISLFLGYVRVRSQSLAGGYLVHLANNTFAHFL
jgi:membrane protease YdiL (CAAX protease family)